MSASSTHAVTRRLTPPHGLAGLQPDGTLWVVMPHPPADLLAAAAPCETCEGRKWVNTELPCSCPRAWLGGGAAAHAHAVDCERRTDCPDCRITLLGECPTCGGISTVPVVRRDGSYSERPCPRTYGCDGTGTVILGSAYAVGGVLPLDEMTARMLAFTLDAPDWHHLVGQYALKLAVPPCSAAT